MVLNQKRKIRQVHLALDHCIPGPSACATRVGGPVGSPSEDAASLCSGFATTTPVKPCKNARYVGMNWALAASVAMEMGLPYWSMIGAEGSWLSGRDAGLLEGGRFTRERAVFKRVGGFFGGRSFGRQAVFRMAGGLCTNRRAVFFVWRADYWRAGGPPPKDPSHRPRKLSTPQTHKQALVTAEDS
jgi:hypothetical protein